MPNTLGLCKQNLKRSIMHTHRIQVQLGWIYDNYLEDYPGFAEEVATAIVYAETLSEYLLAVRDRFMDM